VIVLEANGSSGRPTQRRGFTIIEVMLALGIFSMVLLSIYTVWTSILRATKAARTAADSAQRARISMRALTDALTTAQMFTANMPPQNPNAYYSFIADMSGDFGSLSFVAHLPATFPGVGRYGDQIVRRVTFTIEKDKTEGLNLVMRQGPLMQMLDPDFEPYELVLAKDVQLFGFEFWGQNPRTGQWEWVEEWNSTNQLPRLVHVGLGLGKTANGEAQDVVHRYIALPATAVQPEWQMPGGGAGGGVPGGGVPGGGRPGGGMPGGRGPPGGVGVGPGGRMQ
jgi:prepilin-type N-terminal cleavage/methylation domain-containing protein